MSAITVLTVVALCASASEGFKMKDRYACGVCRDVIKAALAGDGMGCVRFGTCDNINGSLTNCNEFCKDTITVSDAGSPLDLRVAIGFGTKNYGTARVSVITKSSESAPPLVIDGQAVPFDYSAGFKYKWTDNALHSTQIVANNSTVNLTVNGSAVEIKLPEQGAGVAGVLIADPCVDDASITSLVGCSYGKKFQTATRTPALLNAFVGDQKEIDYWGILGDNFYDRTGKVTKVIFSQLSLATKSKPLLTVPGNHDYWVLGAPEVGTVEDQYGNGHMQFYAMDTKAAQHVAPHTSGAAATPYNFSVDPSKGHILFGGNLPAIENSFLYHQVGNLGIVAFSGAYTLSETRPLMAEACSWFSTRAAYGMKAAMIVGHWDVSGLGASKEMAVPAFYDEMKVLPGCDDLDSKGMLKFFMGHTHCNVPHPHGKLNTGFMVAGQGMEGCGNYGIPVFDTTENRLRVYHFQVYSSDGVDTYNEVIGCLQSSPSWRNCTHLAETWLDEPIQ